MQVFINLVDNAKDAINKDGKISININKSSINDINIQIEDDGIGMLDKVQPNIFNLYYTTKAKGTGIGLSIVQRIIFEHEGTIAINSKKEIGTTVSITLPQISA